mmetsp:Transcript_18090/g.60697  ORF Transcript_18090/g.60697 Transcript_18090/m.60697 type:complete len:88 (-) Transcript_18090:44-307(-)
MGGGPQIPYPKWVWTPVGGWYNNYPKNYQRNGLIMAAGWFAAVTAIFQLSIRCERRAVAPHRPIPSQRWCKYAHVDDPSLKARWDAM